MKRFSTGALTIAALLLTAGTAMSQSPSIKADIPFTFYAGAKSMPAGKYEIIRQPAGPISLNGPGGDTTLLPVLTYLGRHDSDTEPELIFDKLQGQMHLSEVWLPGQDGFLLLGTKERHDHEVLRSNAKVAAKARQAK